MRPERRVEMDERSKACAEVVDEILLNGAYKATKFLSDKLTVKATKKRYKGKIRKGENSDIVLTIGKPNFEEREKIKRAKKAGQGPIEMTIKYPPKKK
jgi:hypothetical protein